MQFDHAWKQVVAFPFVGTRSTAEAGRQPGNDPACERHVSDKLFVGSHDAGIADHAQGIFTDENETVEEHTSGLPASNPHININHLIIGK